MLGLVFPQKLILLALEILQLSGQRHKAIQFFTALALIGKNEIQIIPYQCNQCLLFAVFG